MRNVKNNTNNPRLYAHQCNDPSVTSCTCPTILETKYLKYLGVFVDNTLSFRQHIDSLVTRVRKLMFVFKQLRSIADTKLVKQVYFALCQSILQYCITSWGGASKTIILSLERAQRAVLKVANSLPFLFPTNELFRSCEVLTVRQIYILHIVLKQHATLTYNADIINKRRNDIVCSSTTTSIYAFSNKFFTFLGPLLYNRLNRILNIYNLNSFLCKNNVSKYLQGLSYDQTEELLTVCK